MNENLKAESKLYAKADNYSSHFSCLNTKDLQKITNEEHMIPAILSFRKLKDFEPVPNGMLYHRWNLKITRNFSKAFKRVGFDNVISTSFGRFNDILLIQFII